MTDYTQLLHKGFETGLVLTAVLLFMILLLIVSDEIRDIQKVEIKQMVKETVLFIVIILTFFFVIMALGLIVNTLLGAVLEVIP